MKNKWKYFFLFSFIIFCFSYQAQNDSIKSINRTELPIQLYELKNIQPDSMTLKKNIIFKPDSSLKNSVIRSSIKKPDFSSDSLGALKEKIKHSKKNITQNLKTIFPTGNFSLGYDYGFLPYTINMPSPASAIKTEGQIGMNVLNIPLDITWFYSTQKNLIGLNNYFRINYNADRYKEKLNNKLNGNIDSYKSQLGDLHSKRQQLMQKMAFTDYLSSINPDKWPTDSVSKKNQNLATSNYSAPNISDSIKYIPKYNKPDTSYSAYTLKADSSGTKKYTNKSDSIRAMIGKYMVDKQKTDSVKTLYNNYLQQYNSVNDSIKRVQKRIDQLENVNNNPSAYLNRLPYFNKVQNFLSGVKRFEVGLCYPSYSTFLVNNVPVRGINMEYGKNNRFFAFTYGTTVSTLLYNNRSIDGFLQNVRNSYNYFDYNNLTAGRKILSAKFGVGTKEGNHLFAGILIGRGQSSYFNPIPETSYQPSRETNVVIEADAKYKLTEKIIFDLALGKSSLKGEDITYEVIRSAIKEIFSNNNSFALLTRLSTRIDKTKSNLTFTVRYVEPFFKSFGIGFIRSDNLRYEVKLDQPLGKKLKYTGMFRFEEDNVLKLLNYRNTFYSFNNALSLKIKRGLTLRASYTPLLRTLHSETYSFHNKNSITTGVLTYSPKTRKVNLQFNFLYSYYIVNTDTQRINFQNFSYSHQIVLRNGFKTSFNLSWFKNNMRDTSNNNLYLGLLDVGYQFKNGSSVSAGGKSAYKINGGFYPGFVFKSSLKLYKSLYWENQIEKFIVGDLFNGYDYNSLKKFPYYCNTRLTFNF